MENQPTALAETHYSDLREHRPNVAVLPWGATEAHGDHLPFCTDVFEAEAITRSAVATANDHGAKAIMLPPIPFGNNAQQLDQVATIHISTTTALALLRDVVRSLKIQGIKCLIIANTHGGNSFKPIVRDLIHEEEFFIVLADILLMCPLEHAAIFDDPGDHADEMEASVMLHLRPDLVRLDQAGAGKRVPFSVKGLDLPGVWTPRPWSRCHPDTGSGNPRQATAKKGEAFTTHVVKALSTLVQGVSLANSGDNPIP